MHAIKSIPHLDEFIDGYTESRKGVFTNFYLYAPEIERLIIQDRLFCDTAQDGLYIYSDEGSYYRLYFYINTGDIIEDVSMDKPVVCEILFSEGRGEQKRAIEHTMQKFRLNKTSRMFSLNVRENESFINEQYNGIINGLVGEIEIRYATPHDLPVLHRFWRQDLDPVDFPFYTEEELLSFFSAGEVTVAESYSHGVCATLWRTRKGSTAIHKHLTVAETMRDRKIGRLMALDSMKKDLEEGVSVHNCWLDMSNTPTLRMHASVNFTPTKRLSMQFVK